MFIITQQKRKKTVLLLGNKQIPNIHCSVEQRDECVNDPGRRGLLSFTTQLRPTGFSSYTQCQEKTKMKLIHLKKKKSPFIQCPEKNVSD